MEKAILHRDNSVLQVLLGGISALCISLVLILVFALILRFVDLDTSFIMPINQIIKIISIFIGVITVFKKNKSKGFVKGVFIGLVYSVAAYLRKRAISLLRKCANRERLIKNFLKCIIKCHTSTISQRLETLLVKRWLKIHMINYQ